MSAFTLRDLRAAVPPTSDRPWWALHLINVGSDGKLDRLAAQLPQLSKLKINCLILEVDYAFNFQSHPDLRQGEKPITRAARDGLWRRAARTASSWCRSFSA